MWYLFKAFSTGHYSGQGCVDIIPVIRPWLQLGIRHIGAVVHKIPIPKIIHAAEYEILCCEALRLFLGLQINLGQMWVIFCQVYTVVGWLNWPFRWFLAFPFNSDCLTSLVIVLLDGTLGLKVFWYCPCTFSSDFLSLKYHFTINNFCPSLE